MTDPSPVVGIDLGTTRSVVAQLDEFGRPRTLVNGEGELTTPSAVLFEDGVVVVGREALKAISTQPKQVVQFVKREMGSPDVRLSFDGVDYPPEMIQSFILGKLRRDAERALGRQVQSAVVTVPAFFNEPKRRATIDAGLLAGLDVKAIINEPTAAALAYGAASGMLDSSGAFAESQTYLVYDLGGGTFDVSLLKVAGQSVEVIAIDGNARLGGIDWDRCLADWLGEQFAAQFGFGRDQLDEARVELMREAEEIKHALTVRPRVTVRSRVHDEVVRAEVTRELFVELTAHLLDRTRFTVRKVIKDSGVPWSSIDRILLVGGSTRMPQVAEMLGKESGVPVDNSLSPDEAVAHGAAVYAGLALQRDADDVADRPRVTVADVNAHHLGVLGVERATERPIRQIVIPRNTRLPTRRGARFETVKDGQRSVVVRVIEGGDARGQHATRIGTFVVEELPPGLPAGSPVHVVFRYDRDGILDVQAEVPSTGRRASIRIDRAAGLSSAELDEWQTKTRAIHEALGLD